jgi:DNA-binding NarL/FixJ family response regulator
MNPAPPIRVALVEDDRDIREMLTRVVKKARMLAFVGSFASAEEALAELPGLAPDVVIMDLELPGLNGIECTRRVKAQRPQTQVLVFTVFMDSEAIFNALAAGASGYLLKRTPIAGIIDAIEQVAQGGAPMSGEIARKVVESFRSGRRSTPPLPPEPSRLEQQLTPREEEVLQLLAAGQGTKAIASELSLSPETVRFHLKHIYEKLHVRSRTEAVIKYLR